MKKQWARLVASQAHPIPHSVVSIHDLQEKLLDVGQRDKWKCGIFLILSRCKPDAMHKTSSCDPDYDQCHKNHECFFPPRAFIELNCL